MTEIENKEERENKKKMILNGMSQCPRNVLAQIAPITWEHPADRAALQALRSLPGFDTVLKKIYGFFGERGIRIMFQADAVRVGPTQFSRLHMLFTEVCATLDWKEQPELFVTEEPFVNAGAYGMDKPFIVINSAAVKLLDEDETRALLGHELGHVMSGHALYYTMMVLLINVSSSIVPLLGGVVLLPIKLALLEWSRKSEISSDRAGLLAVQNPSAALRMYLKFACGGETKDIDLDAFLTQANEMEGLDNILKILSALGRTHPFNTVRAAELYRWVEQGHYDRILSGEYQNRGSQLDRQKIDSGNIGGYYMNETKTVAQGVARAAKKGIKEGLGRLIK